MCCPLPGVVYAWLSVGGRQGAFVPSQHLPTRLCVEPTRCGRPCGSAEADSVLALFMCQPARRPRKITDRLPYIGPGSVWATSQGCPNEPPKLLLWLLVVACQLPWGVPDKPPITSMIAAGGGLSSAVPPGSNLDRLPFPVAPVGISVAMVPGTGCPSNLWSDHFRNLSWALGALSRGPYLPFCLVRIILPAQRLWHVGRLVPEV